MKVVSEKWYERSSFIPYRWIAFFLPCANRRRWFRGIDRSIDRQDRTWTWTWTVRTGRSVPNLTWVIRFRFLTKGSFDWFLQHDCNARLDKKFEKKRIVYWLARSPGSRGETKIDFDFDWFDWFWLIRSVRQSQSNESKSINQSNRSGVK